MERATQFFSVLLCHCLLLMWQMLTANALFNKVCTKPRRCTEDCVLCMQHRNMEFPLFSVE